MKRVLIALAALLVASQAAAQTRTTELQARSYILSAFMTGAAHAILSPTVELAPALRERLALPPDADRNRIYESLMALTQDREITLRLASPRETAALARQAGGSLVFVLEGAASPLLIAYDPTRDHIPAVGLLGVPWPDPRSEAPAVKPAAVKPHSKKTTRKEKAGATQ